MTKTQVIIIMKLMKMSSLMKIISQNLINNQNQFVKKQKKIKNSNLFSDLVYN